MKLENTYRLEPKDTNKFQTEQVEGLLKDILESRFENMEYDATKCAALSKDLSKFIHTRVRCLGFPRYKYIIHVTIIQNKGQSLQISSRYLWNADHDRYATYTFNNANLIVTAQVYAVYFE
ncbi:hypothetical protein LOTGIDRAFT_128207 [Lottia gigantea]|uniref:Tctex1 domain-containing protein 1 n=1 Tax=Lottia gigantea TaxID=225164 RepID=V3ZWJ7_LOTGI|nr:hypothetical protein LOTGIDRAFT_128207 [Lottia gigantea]ESO86975.1 hypothetical protein LOTGIDRAFT_128207 [Lottia gigantea]